VNANRCQLTCALHGTACSLNARSPCAVDHGLCLTATVFFNVGPLTGPVDSLTWAMRALRRLRMLGCCLATLSMAPFGDC